MKMLSIEEFEANRDVAHHVVLVAAGKRGKGEPCPHCFCGGGLRKRYEEEAEDGHILKCCWCPRELAASAEEMANVL